MYVMILLGVVVLLIGRGIYTDYKQEKYDTNNFMKSAEELGKRDRE